MSRRLGIHPGIGLVPDWCLLIDSERVEPAPGRSPDFGWDAIRLPWRVGLAGIWFQDPRSQDFLVPDLPAFLPGPVAGPRQALCHL